MHPHPEGGRPRPTEGPVDEIRGKIPAFCTYSIRTFVIIIEPMSTPIKDQTRFDARLSKEQKEFFERAASLGGYRNLTEFVFLAAQEKASEIIKEKEQILSSNRDRQIFVDAITSARKPSERLKQAVAVYNDFLSND